MIANFPDEDGFAQIQVVDDRFAQSVDLKVISNFDQLIRGTRSFQEAKTGNSNDLIIYLSDNKSIRVYYSNAYKEVVLSFNFDSKSFIITKLMWIVFKKHFIKIDNLLND